MNSPKMGRPELPADARQGKITAVRLRTDERELLETVAGSENQKLSDWMREVLISSAKNKVLPRTPPPLITNKLSMKKPALPRTAIESQTVLDFTSLKQIEVGGVGMGVMKNGTPYLTGRGLAAMCGIAESSLREMATNWNSEQHTPRGVKITEALASQGYVGKPLFYSIEANGGRHSAYPDAVCMAVLEFYAFDANPVRDQALKNYRLLVRSSLKAFIYVQVGYDPSNRIPDSWRNFHDRVSLVHHKVPVGYFSVFKEIADFIVGLIQQNLPVDDSTVPDISVGIHWGKYWSENKLCETCGERIQYEHNYPEYFPQAKSNPQKPWAYPDAALPHFRKWMHATYLTKKLRPYLQSQEVKRNLPPSFTSLVIKAIAPMAIED